MMAIWQDFFCAVCTSQFLACLEMIKQKPYVISEIEARLPDSRSVTVVVDHRSQWLVLSPLLSYVDRYRLCVYYHPWMCHGNAFGCVSLCVCML